MLRRLSNFLSHVSSLRGRLEVLLRHVDTLQFLRLIQNMLAALVLFRARCCPLLRNKLRNSAIGCGGTLEQIVASWSSDKLRMLTSLPLLLDRYLRQEHLRVRDLLLARSCLVKRLVQGCVGAGLHVIRVYLLAQLGAQLVVELLTHKTISGHARH